MHRRLACLLIILYTLIVTSCVPEPVRPQSGPKGPPAITESPRRKPEEITENMVYIPAGEFDMGCDRTRAKEKCSVIELPLHKIFLNGYYMDRSEVTVASYSDCLAAGACTEPIRTYSDSQRDYFYNPKFANYPVIYVTWFQARDYCTWAGKRLPSEAEWEKAARGPGSTRIYPWGSAAPDCQTANIKVNWKSCRGDVQPVGSYPKDTSPYGVIDMAGNVREWVSDWYDPGYYYKTPYQDPTGPQDGIFVAMRGGRFDNTAHAARIASRRTIGPNDYGAGIGFRCAYTPLQP
jgi:formylglycine-generating enzyme required for sulfatase activity